ncbi:hypothetical protein BASA81_005768 [Batrachochytrium salamandrivorans]|nr:hypothetical protein BASA81_005768 [Batrachochytrium salamandrivorans]
MSKVLTSLQIFRSYMVRHHEDGTLDVSGLVSKACYQEWLNAKGVVESDSEARKYHRTLTNHVSGVDGRSPFELQEEQAILILFRKRKPWPCFPDHLSSLGRRYRTRGYHEKQRSHTVPQRLLPAEELDALLTGLSMQDRAYVQDLSNNIVTKFALASFTMQDWYKVDQVFRYMIWAKTNRCGLQKKRDELCVMAERLCNKFTLDRPDTMVVVLDMSAKPYLERCLAQNKFSLSVCGPLIGNVPAHGADVSELSSVVLAVSVAHLLPGRNICVRAQRYWCLGDTIKQFDMNYFVDPESMLFVFWGKLL